MLKEYLVVANEDLEVGGESITVTDSASACPCQVAFLLVKARLSVVCSCTQTCSYVLQGGGCEEKGVQPETSGQAVENWCRSSWRKCTSAQICSTHWGHELDARCFRRSARL